LYHLVLALSLLPVSLLKSSPNQHNNTHQYNKTENIHRYNKIKEKTRNFFTFLSLSDLKCSSREGVYLFVIGKQHKGRVFLQVRSYRVKLRRRGVADHRNKITCQREK
jgi:hypothetical protein